MMTRLPPALVAARRSPLTVREIGVVSLVVALMHAERGRPSQQRSRP
jgi:hypothetical protein